MAELGLGQVEWLTPFPWTTQNGCRKRSGHDGNDSETKTALLADDQCLSNADKSGTSFLTAAKDGQEQETPCLSQTEKTECDQAQATSFNVAIFLCMALQTVLVWAAISLMIPFLATETFRKFPEAGAVHHVSVGLIFGIATYVEFIFSPLVAKDLHNAGSKLVLVLSTVLIAGSLFLFSFVYRITDWATFLGLCLTLRFVQGVATAASFVSANSVIMGAFPESNGVTSGAIRALSGFGYAVGPAIGGFLYDHGGFALPFYVGSGLILATAVVLLVFLPSQEDELSSIALESDVGLTTILRIPWVVVVIISVVLLNAVAGSVEPTLPVYFKKSFNASSTLSGVALLVYGLVYMATALSTGYCIDRWQVSVRQLEVIGMALSVLGCQLVGPASFLPLPKSIGLSYFGMALIGFAGAIFLTSAFPDLLQTFTENGISNPLRLRALAAGLFQAGSAMGYGTGPIVGSALTSWLGFADAASALGGIYLVWMVVVISCALCIRLQKCHLTRQNVEYPKLSVPEMP